VSGSARADFFVSYTQADRAWAEWIGWHLEQAGYTVIVQAWDFLPGTDWVHQMHTAVQRAERTLAVLSPAYLESSEFGEAEWRVAFAADPIGEGRRLIPVRVLECHPEGLLKTRVYVDLAGRGERDAAAALLRGLSEHAGRPGSKPAFPGVRAAAAADRPRFPGTLPAVFTVPFTPNLWFAGRSGTLAAIRSRLADTGSGCVVPITGIGGVGKTQLVVEYAYAERTSYDVIWWVRAQPLAMTRADLAALVADPHLPDPPQLSARASVEDRLAAARDWLERHDRCLLIVDNVDDSATVRPLLPRAGGGHVLLTARSDVDWTSWATPLQLDMLEAGDASRFLCDRSGDPDEAAAAALATELGRLPLALEQAAGYIAETGGLTLAGYLTLFRTRGRELLGRGRPADRDDTVNTTWSLSLDQLTQASPSAVDLLTLAAFLAADDIPIPLLTEQASQLPGRLAETVADPLALADTIGVLRRYGLAKAAADAITVHRLLQAVVRNGLDEDTQSRWAEFALRVAWLAWPDHADHPDTWPRCARLLPHVLTVVGHPTLDETDPKTTALLLTETGRYLWSRAEFQQAATLYERELAIREMRLGADHPDTARSISSLAAILHDRGDLDHARTLHERALAIRVSQLGPNHPATARSIDLLGNVLHAQGNLDAARALHERAIAICETHLKPDHPDTAISISNLAGVLNDQGDLDRARALFERALSIRETHFGADHPITAHGLNNLAAVLHDQGDLDGARTMHERALAIYEAHLGADHPTTAHTLNNIASILHDQGDLDGARTMHERALAIYEAHLGADHPTTAHSLNNLALVVHDQGDLDGARVMLERALAIYEARLGDNHPNVANTLDNLGFVLHDQADADGARARHQRARSIRGADPGADDQNPVRTRQDLAAAVVELETRS
jgi:tetratricopeptide (TPR) repeat protein